MTARTTSAPGQAAPSSGFGLLALGGLLWGTGGVSGAMLAESSGLSGPAVATYRLALGGGLLVLVLLAQRRWVPRSRPARGRIVATGLLAAAFQASYFGAVGLASVSLATLVTIGSAPMIVVLVQSLRRRSMPSARQIRPLLLGVTGLVLLVGGPAPPGTDAAQALLGILLAVCAGASFAFLSMLAARPHRDTDAPLVTGYGFLLGGLVLAVCVLPIAPLTVEPTARNLGLVAFLAVFPTALAWTLYFAGLAHAGPAVATVVALLEPLTATVLAVLILGESVTITLVLGGALLLVSVLDARPRPVRPAAP